MNEAEAFLAQNPLSAEGITVEQAEDYATHHSGGLIVLLRYLDEPFLAKLHDSWGGEEEVIVHRYDPNAADESTDQVWGFTDAAEAYRFFSEEI